ncbi:hypothetical protein C2E23DRAFT_866303 [Lenzites betulinus]|nr:hypothetical protein C2E23DRAFT_866303 [Lenzites betulinus]
MRDFWWKALHDAHRVGTYWEHIPQYEHRAQCPHCSQPDTIEHILLECEEPGQRFVWEEARALPRLSVGLVLGAPALRLTSTPPALSAAQQRLTRLLLTESAFVVWRLRNCRVIGGPLGEIFPCTKTAIVNAWYAAVNKRLLMDCLLTSPRFGRAAVRRRVVLDTWDRVLEDRAGLPEDWTQGARVLVGRPLTASAAAG